MWIISIPLLALLSSILGLILNASLLIILGLIILMIFIPAAAFFRDPERRIGDGVVSPADGKVTRVLRKGRWVTVSVFMNVYNVHVNRAPWSGRVLKQEYFRGSFRPAFSKDSDRNERLRTLLRTNEGNWEIVQIAGAAARRIVPYVEEGDVIEKGDRIGMIRFGSRVDLRFRLPRGYSITVKEGDAVRAGSSTLAR